MSPEWSNPFLEEAIEAIHQLRINASVRGLGDLAQTIEAVVELETGLVPFLIRAGSLNSKGRFLRDTLINTRSKVLFTLSALGHIR